MLAETLSWCLCSSSLCTGSHLSETINKYTFYLANLEDFECPWENPCGFFPCFFLSFLINIKIPREFDYHRGQWESQSTASQTCFSGKPGRTWWWKAFPFGKTSQPRLKEALWRPPLCVSHMGSTLILRSQYCEVAGHAWELKARYWCKNKPCSVLTSVDVHGPFRCL